MTGGGFGGGGGGQALCELKIDEGESSSDDSITTQQSDRRADVTAQDCNRGNGEQVQYLLLQP